MAEDQEVVPGVFDFMGDEDGDGIATSGNPEILHQGLTYDQIEAAQKAAQSPGGLDMGLFMQKTGVYQIDFDQVLNFKLQPREDS